MVYAGVTYLNQQVDAFKNLIKLRDASIRDLEKADKSLAGKKAERESTGNGDKPLSGGVFSFSNKSETLNEAIAREEQDVRAKRRTVEAMARALFFSEIDRFNQDRQETMESAMACLAASELMVSTKNAKLFAAFFTSMKLDSGEWSTKAKDVLSLQVSCLPKPDRCTSSCSVQTHQSKRTDPQILKTTIMLLASNSSLTLHFSLCSSSGPSGLAVRGHREPFGEHGEPREVARTRRNKEIPLRRKPLKIA